MSLPQFVNFRVAIASAICRRYISNRAKANLSHFKEVNPKDCLLMLQTKTRRFKDKKEVEVFTHY